MLLFVYCGPQQGTDPIRTTAMNKIKAYLEEVVKEMQKVNWPKQKELTNNTIITLVATVIISLFIFGADRLISQILEFVY